MGFEELIAQNAGVIGLISLIIIPIKGYALWTSARRNEKWWFIALLVINTLAILELIYLFAVAKVQDKDRKPEAKKPEPPKIPDAPKETPKM
jgi:hypothetical protein